MMFADDLAVCFEKEVNNKKNSVKINEEFLFRTLIGAINKAALRNGYSANVLEIHKSCINFREINRFPFYNKKDQSKPARCELADIMFIIYNDNEARLCFMQNKYDKRINRRRDFTADTRQFYVLKNRPRYWLGKKNSTQVTTENILYNAEYNSITTYGVFTYDNIGKRYDMEYYNADAILPPKAGGRYRVLKFNNLYEKCSTIKFCIFVKIFRRRTYKYEDWTKI